MVNNKSGGEKGSIGNMDAKVDNKVVRVGANWFRNAARLLLMGGEHDLMIQIQIVVPLSAQKDVSLVSAIALIFKKLISFYKRIPPLRELLPFGLDPLTNWY